MAQRAQIIHLIQAAEAAAAVGGAGHVGGIAATAAAAGAGPFRLRGADARDVGAEAPGQERVLEDAVADDGDERAEAGDAGADDGDVGFERGPDAEIHAAPCIVWARDGGQRKRGLLGSFGSQHRDSVGGGFGGLSDPRRNGSKKGKGEDTYR